VMEADHSECSAADVDASVIPGKLETDALKKFQKKANSPLNTKRCTFVYVERVSSRSFQQFMIVCRTDSCFAESVLHLGSVLLLLLPSPRQFHSSQIPFLHLLW